MIVPTLFNWRPEYYFVHFPALKKLRVYPAANGFFFCHHVDKPWFVRGASVGLVDALCHLDEGGWSA